MASRKEQKEAARQRRLAEERVQAEKARRVRRLRMLGGMLVLVIVVVGAAIAISSGGGGGGAAAKPDSPQAKQSAATVDKLLAGIPQSGNTLGSPNAKVTLTEYGDLVCPICRDFAMGALNQLISKDVRAGKVKVVYKPLETASQTANNAMFVPGQAAALAAGEQKLGWNYIELFYHEQGDETQSYVTDSFLNGLAKQITGLNYSKWSSDRQSAALATQVNTGQQSAISAGYNSTPTIVVQGISQAKPIVGAVSYSQLESTIKSVS